MRDDQAAPRLSRSAEHRAGGKRPASGVRRPDRPFNVLRLVRDQAPFAAHPDRARQF